MSDPSFLGRVAYCALLPHAPILVPGVGGPRENDVALSVAAMRDAARRAIATRSDTLVIISPHSPRVSESFGIWTGERLCGSLKAFGCSDTTIDLPKDTVLVETIAHLSRKRGVRTAPIAEPLLDHGATVPLWYAAEAGWRGPLVVLGLGSLAQRDFVALGEIIAEAAAFTGRRVALIASGDMSHRLTVGAPFGFSARGLEFDDWMLDTLRRGEYQGLLKLDPGLKREAAEDALDSVLVAVGAVGFSSTGAEVLNYERPFGVGYGVAILYSEKKAYPQEPTDMPWSHS